jgi:hypothetical protein
MAGRTDAIIAMLECLERRQGGGRTNYGPEHELTCALSRTDALAVVQWYASAAAALRICVPPIPSSCIYSMKGLRDGKRQ